jgi:hypothetical protein
MPNSLTKIFQIALLGFASATFFGFAASSRGDTLGLQLMAPDVTVQNIQMNFIADTTPGGPGGGHLHVTGLPTVMRTDDPAPPTPPTYQWFDDSAPLGVPQYMKIDADLDANGKLIPGTGSLSIKGIISSLGPTMSGDLLYGDLTDFGFLPDSPGAPLFEFTFKMNGAIAEAFNSVGATGGVVLLANADDYLGTFDRNFSNTGSLTDYADVARVAVPLPRSVWGGLALFGTTGAFARFRRFGGSLTSASARAE